MKKKGKYITREDAIARLLGGMDEHLREPYSEYIRMLIYTVPDAVQEPHWIPCKERLPELDEICLVTEKDGSIRHCYFDSADPVLFATFEEGLYVRNVVAWMPLPAPYNGERENDE